MGKQSLQINESQSRHGEKSLSALEGFFCTTLNVCCLVQLGENLHDKICTILSGRSVS